MANRWRWWVALIATVMAAAGCGDGTTVRVAGPEGSVPVRVSGTLEERDGRWRLCLGGGGPCWDVDGRAHDLDGGPASVTGSWDGSTLVVSEGPTPVPGEAVFPNPCPDVEAMSGTNGDDRVMGPVQEYLATIDADRAGSWLARPGPVFVVAVVDNADRHRAEIARRADRGVCVTSDGFRYTEAELRRVQEELRNFDAEWRSKGWAMTWSSGDVVDNVVEVGFARTDPVLEAELRERWGDRVVARGIIGVLEGTVDDLPRRVVGDDEIAIDTNDLGVGHMDALGTFVLRFDAEADCVWFDAGGERVKPVFPAGWRALRDPVRVLDGRGDVVATIDESFETGGGSGRPPAPGDPFACGAISTWII